MKPFNAYGRLSKYSKSLAAVALFISVATLAISAQLPVPSPQIDISNFGEINEKYYRGSQPDAMQVAALKKSGIKTIIDLRKDFEPEEAQWAQSQGLQYFRIPLSTKTAATAEQTAEFLKLANDPGNWPVYVHCKGGRHRTGEMTAIYRISNDQWTADQAYQEMKKYDFESGWFGGPGVLKKYVFRFYEQKQKASSSTTQNIAVGSEVVP
jgi:protein tyrosine/serine phosphatase